MYIFAYIHKQVYIYVYIWRERERVVGITGTHNHTRSAIEYFLTCKELKESMFIHSETGRYWKICKDETFKKDNIYEARDCQRQVMEGIPSTHS
jgi:hypothetical protein